MSPFEALGEDEATPPKSPLRFRPTPGDWNSVRPVIKQLYVEENKTLKEVMEIMDREYSHRGT
jgi:hypothetical protein